jgi:type II secretory pathway component PulF
MAVLGGAFGLLAVGLALLAALRFLPTALRGNDDVGLLLSVGGWVLTALGVFGICLSFMSPLWAIIYGFALLFVALMAVNRRGRAQRRMLLQMLAAAAERGLPLAPAAAAMADEAAGKVGRQAGALARLLSGGAPLPDALRMAGSLVARQQMALIWLGAETGALDAALREASRETDREAVLGGVIVHLMYFFALLWIGGGIVIFVMLKIVPAFKQIFEDFDTELPEMTVALIDMTMLMTDFWFLLIPLLPVFLGVFCYVVLVYLGWIDMRPPIVDRLLRRFDTAFILRGLAVAVETQHPLDRALGVLAGVHPAAWVREKLARAAEGIWAGAHWCDSLHHAGLLRRDDVQVLRSAERAGNLAWALRAVADCNERRLAYRLRIALETASPLVLLALGAVVFVIVVALFLPLVKILEALT